MGLSDIFFHPIEAKFRTAQQTSFETPTSTHPEPEESHKAGDTEGTTATNEQLSSTQVTEEQEGKTDDKERQSPTTETRERETENEGNKENTRATEAPQPSLNTDQTNNKTPDNTDGKPKIVWVLKKTENADPQTGAQNVTAMNAESKEENESGTQQAPKEGSPTSPESPAHKESLMNDPLVVQRASELVSLVKSQSLSQKGPRKYVI